MKILHVIDSEGLYGAEVMLLNLAFEQRKIGLRPGILNMRLCECDGHSLGDEARKMGLEFHALPLRSGIEVLETFGIIRFAQINGYALFHTHGYKPNILLGLMPKRFRKLPLVSTLHGWTSTERFTKLRFYEWLDFISLRFIDAVVLVNRAMKCYTRLRDCNALNLYVINNGIPIPESTCHPNNGQGSTSSDLDKTIIDFCKKGFTIGSIGRLSTEKGYRHLIEAVASLVRKGLDVHLVIIGEGYERQRLEALVRQLELSDRVILPGYRPYARNYIAFFSIFVISSLTEGLPITVLEAMQAKVPVVATRVGAIPELLQSGRGGLLVEPHNPRLLSDAISSLYHNAEFANQLASVSYQEAVHRYTSDAMTLQYLDIYKTVIQRNQARTLQ